MLGNRQTHPFILMIKITTCESNQHSIQANRFISPYSPKRFLFVPSYISKTLIVTNKGYISGLCYPFPEILFQHYATVLYIGVCLQQLQDVVSDSSNRCLLRQSGLRRTYNTSLLNESADCLKMDSRIWLSN